MSRGTPVPADLRDAAAVNGAREEILEALGALAATPLAAGATARMRSALERADSPAVRRAVARLEQLPALSSGPSPLSIVPSRSGAPAEHQVPVPGPVGPGSAA